jgi:hypothetical protein
MQARLTVLLLTHLVLTAETVTALVPVKLRAACTLLV